MKTMFSRCAMFLAGALTIGLSASAETPSEAYYVVRIQDIDRKVTSEVLSAEEFKTLSRNLQLEQRYFQEAVQKAGKEWRDDESNKGIPFAGTQLSPRRLLGTAERFANREKADKQLSIYQERELKQKTGKLPRTGRVAEKTDKDIEREARLSRAAEIVRGRLAEVISSKAAPSEPAAPAAKDAGPAKDAAPAKDAPKQGK